MSELIDFSSLAPIVLKARGAQWKNIHLLDKLLTGELRNVLTKWRVCPLNTRRTIREFESIFVEASFEEFYEWYQGKPSSSGDNPFIIVPAEKDEVVSVYADYQHFNEVFQGLDIPDFGNLIELYGTLPDPTRRCQSDHDEFIHLFAPEKLTLWLSTRGAHTPLHYDAYGCNVVMQVKGSKKWQLWQPNSFSTVASSSSSIPSSSSPPSSSSSSCFNKTCSPPPPSTSSTSSSSSCFKKSSSSSYSPIERVPPMDPSRGIGAPSPISRNTPTLNRKIIPTLPCLRIPFEESSVYSTYDPRTFTVNDVGHIPPSHSIVLEEGDVLFIPKHYWHFVETVSDLSFSVNLWLPFPLPPQPSFFPSETVQEDVGEQDCRNDGSSYKIKENYNDKNSKSNNDGTKNNSKNRNDRNSSKDSKDRKESVCMESDAHSHLLEAATRFLFGSLKGCIHTLFDTDDGTAGWVNPSEQGGTLDSSWNLPSSSSSSLCFEKGDKNERNKVNKDKNEDSDHHDDDEGDEDKEEVDRSASNESEGTRDEAAAHHLAYLYNSIIGYRKTERDNENEKYDNTIKENKRSRKEMSSDNRENKGRSSSDQDCDSDRNEGEAVGESRDDRCDKAGMNNKKFEEFLKRFVNAVLQPDRIEQCLMESLHCKT